MVKILQKYVPFHRVREAASSNSKEHSSYSRAKQVGKDSWGTRCAKTIQRLLVQSNSTKCSKRKSPRVVRRFVFTDASSLGFPSLGVSFLNAIVDHFFGRPTGRGDAFTRPRLFVCACVRSFATTNRAPSIFFAFLLDLDSNG